MVRGSITADGRTYLAIADDNPKDIRYCDTIVQQLVDHSPTDRPTIVVTVFQRDTNISYTYLLTKITTMPIVLLSSGSHALWSS